MNVKIIFNCYICLFLSLSVNAQIDTTSKPSSTPAEIRVDTLSKLPQGKSQIAADSMRQYVAETLAVQKQQGRERIYKLRPAVDIPIMAAGAGWSLFAFTQIYRKPYSSEQQILSLNRNNINAFDRWAVYPYSASLDKVSYYPFYAAMPLPLVFFLTGNEMRKDFFQLSFLYCEALSVMGLFGTGATYFVDKYRPYAYSSATPLDKREAPNAKNSFYAGHVQIITLSTFFIAKVYSDYYPESKIKWVFYGGASLAMGSMGFMRLRDGQHFPSDVLLGAAMGSLTGILVPEFHKNKKHSFTLLPYSNGSEKGLTFTYLIR